MGIIEPYLTPVAFRMFEAPESNPISPGVCPTLELIYKNFNGGLFWGGALLIRPNQKAVGAPLTVTEWNHAALWKGQYEEVCTDITFFAEDAFGIQFGVKNGRIVQFDPETASIATVAETIDEWCQELRRDPNFYTGSPVLTAWERENHPLSVGCRLVPRQLFMLGGDFTSDNMISKTDVDGMRLRAQFWKLTRDLPDGQRVVFRVEE
jgi:hypothetical protein